MSAIEVEVLERLQISLVEQEGLQPGLAERICAELASVKGPNPEHLRDLFRSIADGEPQ